MKHMNVFQIFYLRLQNREKSYLEDKLIKRNVVNLFFNKVELDLVISGFSRI